MRKDGRHRFTEPQKSQTALHIDGPAAIDPPVCHLVVGFDRGAGSHAALAFAVDFALHIHAGLHVAHSVDPNDLPIDPDSPTYETEFADGLDYERIQACSMLAPLPGNWTYDCVYDDPMRLLTSIAETYDALMIIIGTPRRGFISMMERVSGESVSAHLIHKSHRPLLMIPTETRFSGWTGAP
ncbi:universal stress protein [Rhodococcus sp. PvP104]|uniref:universal stress protein n=1 Tax=Rhodococcus sp. PvP104 TaxID=2817911 RepID=UPI001AE33E99|nr:universal stress protein [Rhodococcus sp. PvP104]MBP2527285.1 nucleotide-binding universal stress UspA family protein [Rhodococcus sp. PvP104]